MTTLHLLRHAKSSWDDEALPDAERPLAPRGHRDVAALASFFAASDLRVDLALVSPARRTRETWSGVATGVQGDPIVRVEPQIYEASVDDLLEILHGVDDDLESVLLVGHNPGIERLAVTVAGGGDADALASLRSGYPTGGFATLTFDTTWRDLAPRSAQLVGFVRPRDLRE